MSPAALAHHYPFAHWPRPQLIPHFHQRGDGITRCLVTPGRRSHALVPPRYGAARGPANRASPARTTLNEQPGADPSGHALLRH